MGAGTVYSAPGAINCGSTCSGPFAYNALVSLTAIPDVVGGLSSFTGWGGDCDGNGQVTMGANKTCTANFTTCAVNTKAMVGSASFASINEAYTHTLSNSFTIKTLASNQAVDALDFASGKDITLQGGWNCAFSQQVSPAVTFLTGSLTLTSGSVTFDGTAIK